MTTLKISDLSVGDWVRHDFYEVDMRVVTIYGDNKRVIAESSSGYGVTCHLDHFTPIPITEEILEKNGWGMRPPGHSTCECNGTYVGIVNTTRDYGVSVIDDDGIRMGVDYLLYVHQLQHALRLAGVDKEITL